MKEILLRLDIISWRGLIARKIIKPHPLQIARMSPCNIMLLGNIAPNKKTPKPLTSIIKLPSFARFSISVKFVKYSMLAGRPKAKDAPNKIDTTQAFNILVVLTNVKLSEENIPNTIQDVRNVSLFLILSVSAAPARAENTAPLK